MQTLSALQCKVLDGKTIWCKNSIYRVLQGELQKQFMQYQDTKHPKFNTVYLVATSLDL